MSCYLAWTSRRRPFEIALFFARSAAQRLTLWIPLGEMVQLFPLKTALQTYDCFGFWLFGDDSTRSLPDLCLPAATPNHRHSYPSGAHLKGWCSPLGVKGLRAWPVLGVVVQGTHSHLYHGARRDALPQHLAVLCRLAREPVGTHGSLPLDAK